MPKTKDTPTPQPKDYFPKVKEARDAIKAKALDLFELQLKLIMEAVNKGEIEAALDANQWLMEHMPNEDGDRMIDPSGAKAPKEVETGPKGPTIQIGIALGGVGTKQLPSANIIDITPDE